MIFHSALVTLGFITSLISQTQARLPAVRVVPTTPFQGPSDVQFVSGDPRKGGGFDGPKVNPVNGTVFDWWYFDVVAHDLSSSIVVVFFTTTDLWIGNPTRNNSIDYVITTVSFANGTVYDGRLLPDQFTITTNGDGSSGMLPDHVAGWKGSSDMKHWSINFNAPEIGLKGSVSMNSVAPAHIPCGPYKLNKPGQDLLVSPQIGWANAVPDSDAKVDVSVYGEKVKFSGLGYHDKNWGDAPLPVTVSSWYWGHGRIGPLSIVWFSVLTKDGGNSLSSYVSRNGKIIASSCSDITVRPSGANSTYPPTLGIEPEGFDIKIKIPYEGTLHAKVKAKQVVAKGFPVYLRWIGELTGGIVGKEVWHGASVYEQFTFP